jgi:flavin reductase (DIM6/NTAB) family NADH-FMN oxidoreductase RutF
VTTGYLRYLTSTVGLITTVADKRVNVMAAEWSYFVAREPLHIAVGISDQNWSNSQIRKAGEFAVTLCTDSQVALAAFAGSLSGLDVDKTSSADLELAEPTVLSTPHVRGGVLNAECVVREVVELPGYALVIGEAVWTHADEDAAAHPLVKHGTMHELGPTVTDHRVTVAAGFPNPAVPVLRVAATTYQAPPDAPWQISVFGTTTGVQHADLSLAESGGLLMVDVDLPPAAGRESLTVEVSRAECRAGRAHPTAEVLAAVS